MAISARGGAGLLALTAGLVLFLNTYVMHIRISSVQPRLTAVDIGRTLESVASGQAVSCLLYTSDAADE